MFKLLNRAKNKKGFTLIELIVVIAILGILAAILVPSMLGIIGDARKKTNNANARSVFTAAQAYVTTQGSTSTPIGDGPFELIEGGSANDPEAVAVKGYLGAGFTGCFKFTVSNGGVTSAEYSANATFGEPDDGIYPTAEASTPASSTP